MNAKRWRDAGLVAMFATAVAGLPEASAGGPSPEYRAGLKRTLELKRQRRGEARARFGAIVPYPMPPALIVRQTRENHDEIRTLLGLLRYEGR